MDSAWTSIIVFVLSVFVLIFFVGQAFFAGGEKVTTETAFTYSMTEDIPFEGVFLRDETVIHNSGTGVVDYEHSDGSKVGKSSVIARRYRSEADIERRSEIEKINEQIAVLTDAQRLAGTDNNQLETISSQINERHSLILESLIDGDYSSAHAQENAMLGVLSKREISRGDIASYESKISSLRSRASQLEAMLSGDVQDIEAGGAGYFVSSGDGDEGDISGPGTEWCTGHALATQATTLRPLGASGAALYRYDFLFANTLYPTLAEQEIAALREVWG